MWTLCLTGAGCPRTLLQDIDPSMTLEALFRKAEAALLLNNEAQQKFVRSLKTGFPPKPLERSNGTTLLEAGLRNQERIVVELDECVVDDQNDALTTTTKTTKKKQTTTKSLAKSKSSKVPSINNKKRKQYKQKDTKDDENDDDEYDDQQQQQEKEENQNYGESKDDESDNQPQQTRTSKRAAAAAATASFADTMKAQDEFEASLQQSSSKNSSSNNNKRSVSKRVGTVIAASSSSSPKKKTRFDAASTTGRRLQDGAVVRPQPPSSSSSSRRSTRSTSRRGGSQSQPPTDPSLALLDALSSSSKGARLMRHGWRRAVSDAEEQSRALQRLASVLGHSALFHVVGSGYNNNTKDDTTLSSLQQQLLVTYPRGIQGRGTYNDQVDLLPADVLESVIGAIHPANQEALRPENLALLSPRVLWSCIYHYKHKNKNDSTSVAAALQAMGPAGLDWSFLRRRKEKLSEKALENLRQQQEAEAEASSSKTAGDDWEAAALAIEAVEHAMDELHTFSQKEQAAQLAQAAQRRLQQQHQQQQNQEVWTLITPSESDEDELIACIRAAGEAEITGVEIIYFDDDVENSKDEKTAASTIIITMESSDDEETDKQQQQQQHRIPVSSVVEWLMNDCRIHNWRQLANVSDTEQLAEGFAVKFAVADDSDKDSSNDNSANKKKKKKKTNNNSKKTLTRNNNSKTTSMVLIQEMVDAWVAHAQSESLSEIMFEICDGDLDALDVLRDAARSATPKDLAVWSSIVEELHAVLNEYAAAAAAAEEEKTTQNNNKKSKSDDNYDGDDEKAVTVVVVPNINHLQEWCDRARLALRQLEWLNWFATPVSDD